MENRRGQAIGAERSRGERARLQYNGGKAEHGFLFFFLIILGTGRAAAAAAVGAGQALQDGNEEYMEEQ